jgi:DNA-binding NtrC family response regulator
MPKDLILCVDDEAIILRLCSIAVAEAGFRVAVAENGAAGLEAFRRLRDDICLILADIVLPGKISGIDLTEKILRIDPQAKFLLMTGYTDEIIDMEGQTNFPIIRKPFLAGDLVKKIRFILGVPDSAASNH